MERQLLEVGERVGPYEVLDAKFCDLLPYAVIVEGSNVGVTVILTSPFREIGGAASRLERFVASGDTTVLVEDL
jgi:hypothetical protein